MPTPANNFSNQSEDPMSLIYESMNRSPYPILIGESNDQNGNNINLIYANQSFFDLAGIDSSQLTNIELFDLMSDYIDVDQLNDIKSELTANGKTEKEIFFLKPNAGKGLHHRITIKKIESGPSDKIHFSVFLYNIEDLKDNIEKTRMHSVLLDNINNAILIVDEHEKVIYNNAYTRDLLGMSVTTGEDSSLYDCVHNDIYKKLVKIKGSLGKKSRTTGEISYILNDRQHMVRSTWVPYEANGRKYYLSSNIDITEKKALENKLISNHRHSIMSLLANGIAHDIHNLLSPVINTLDFLGSLDKNKTEKKYFDIALDSTRRASSLIDKMLSFSRGGFLEKSSVDVRDVVRDLVQIMNHTLPKNINISTNIPTVMSKIMADYLLIYQVLINMCLNSADAMPDGGYLSISVEETDLGDEMLKDKPEIDHGRYIKITIQDTGTGIPDDVQKKIFDPFFSLRESKMGLGLYTCYEIINEHGGFINVYSTEGKGTLFDIYIPAVPGDQVDDSESTKKEDLQEKFLKYCGNGETILVADDELAIKETLKMVLNKCNYNVITACDGAEAIKVFIENIHDIKLAILDIVMPVMDGTTTAKALKKYNGDLKIILTTGFEGHKPIDRDAHDIDRFIRKPYSSVELLEVVSSLLK